MIFPYVLANFAVKSFGLVPGLRGDSALGNARIRGSAEIRPRIIEAAGTLTRMDTQEY